MGLADEIYGSIQKDFQEKIKSFGRDFIDLLDEFSMQPDVVKLADTAGLSPLNFATQIACRAVSETIARHPDTCEAKKAFRNHLVSWLDDYK